VFVAWKPTATHIEPLKAMPAQVPPLNAVFPDVTAVHAFPSVDVTIWFVVLPPAINLALPYVIAYVFPGIVPVPAVQVTPLLEDQDIVAEALPPPASTRPSPYPRVSSDDEAGGLAQVTHKEAAVGTGAVVYMTFGVEEVVITQAVPVHTSHHGVFVDIADIA
jgi:hypothetical protein